MFTHVSQAGIQGGEVRGRQGGKHGLQIFKQDDRYIIVLLGSKKALLQLIL